MCERSSRHLCDRCHVCFRYIDAQDLGNQQRYLPTDPGFNHHRTWASFDNALQGFCVICNYLWSFWSPSTATDYATTWQWSTTKPGEIRLRFNLRTQKSVYLLLNVVEERLALTRYQENLIATHTSDDAVLQTARSWFKYCVASHKLCTAHYAADPCYPTRLIDLISTNWSPDNTWRLIEKPSAPEVQGGYATLSHRWGSEGSEPFKLIELTRDAMCKGLPDSCLHGTYRDAMKVTRKLGLRYIWIDSLCILQDPESLNVQVEAHRMAEVYGHSACNISALTAKQDTMFVGRKPELYSPSTIMIPGVVYDLKRSYAIRLGHLWENSVLNSALTRRGWILQEQLLPKRVLYFGERQVLWSCLEGGFCETYPLDDTTVSWMDDGLSQGDTALLRKSLSYAINHSLATKGKAAVVMPDDQDGRVVEWLEVLSLYGHRQLTIAADKLLAVAGIGQLIGTMLKDRLVGGLFVNELPMNLLWIMDHLAARKTAYGLIQRSSVARAPSWSWAYYDGPISFFTGPGYAVFAHQRAVARVTALETETTLIEDIEIVQGGALHLFGAHLPLELRTSDADGGNVSSSYWFMPFVTASSSPPRQGAGSSQSGIHLTVGGVHDHDEPDWREADEDGLVLFDLLGYQSLNTPLTAVFVTCQFSPVDLDKTRFLYRFDGLVLRRHPLRVDDDVWERLGVFVVLLYTDGKVRPDVPMTRDWNFDEFELDEEGDPEYPEYGFDGDGVGGFMQAFEIV